MDPKTSIGLSFPGISSGIWFFVGAGILTYAHLKHKDEKSWYIIGGVMLGASLGSALTWLTSTVEKTNTQ